MNKFKLITRFNNGKEIRSEFDNAHDAKSLAGSLIHLKSVKSVCVAGLFSGIAYFYISESNPSANRVSITSDIAEIVENLILDNRVNRKQAEVVFDLR